MDEPVTVPGIPLALRPLGDPEAWSVISPQALAAVAGPRTDWFVPPDGAGPPVMNAPALVGEAAGDYLLAARVSVGFAATYDAGVLALHADDRCWAKLCFERAPDGTTMVVSVVTRDVSDDCNSFAVERDHVWLRIARRGPSFAFHASLDGRLWQLVRHFALGAGTEPALGFLAQSPTGEGCTVTFEEIAFEVGRLDDIRSGTSCALVRGLRRCHRATGNDQGAGLGLGSSAISFGYQLASAPAPHFRVAGSAPTATCPGTAANPQAARGHLCVYEGVDTNAQGQQIGNPVTNLGGQATRFGAFVLVTSTADGAFASGGTWAVTSP